MSDPEPVVSPPGEEIPDLTKPLKTLRTIGGSVLLLIVLGLASLAWNNHVAVKNFLRTPMAPGKMVNVGGHRIYATVEGDSAPTVVLFDGLGSLSIEWRDVRRQLAKRGRVVTWDRPGIGWSDPVRGNPSAIRAAAEAETLLDSLHIAPPYLLVGQSIGAVYADRFARTHPDQTAALIVIEPLNDDREWRDIVSVKTFDTYIDPSTLFKKLRPLARFGLTRLIDLAPKGIPLHVRQAWRTAYADPDFYTAVLAEHDALHADFDSLATAPPFPPIPLWVIYHSRFMGIAEMRRFHASERTAKKVEAARENLTRHTWMRLSPKARWFEAEIAGHNLQFEDPKLIVSTVEAMLDSLRHGGPR